MNDIVLNNGWPTTWQQRVPKFDLDRSQRIVIDPYSYVVANPNDRNNLLVLNNKWFNHKGLNHFYRVCTDPDNSIERELVANFNEICYIDYKIFSINLSNHNPMRTLQRILSNSTPFKLLHISLDEQECRYPEALLDSIKGIQFNGTLAIEIVESCALRFSETRARNYLKSINLAPNLISVDYHYNLDSERAVFMDLLDRWGKPLYYDTVQSKRF